MAKDALDFVELIGKYVNITTKLGENVGQVISVWDSADKKTVIIAFDLGTRVVISVDPPEAIRWSIAEKKINGVIGTDKMWKS